MRYISAILIVLLLTITAFAAVDRDELRITTGALRETLGGDVLATYIDGVGIVIIASTDMHEHDITQHVERIVRFTIPALESVGDAELITIVVQASNGEIHYEFPKRDADRPDWWDVDKHTSGEYAYATYSYGTNEGESSPSCSDLNQPAAVGPVKLVNRTPPECF